MLESKWLIIVFSSGHDIMAKKVIVAKLMFYDCYYDILWVCREREMKEKQNV